MGRFDDRLVSRQVALGGEDVHGLGACDPWDQLHREGGDLFFGIDRHLVAVHQRVKDRDERLPGSKQGHFVHVQEGFHQGPLHLEDDVCLAKNGLCVRDDACACLLIGLVQEKGTMPRVRFQQHRQAHGCKLLHCFRRSGHAFFRWPAFLWDSDFHRSILDERCETRRR